MQTLGPERPLMLVGGEWVESHSGRRYAVANPARGDELSTAPLGDADDVRAAVDAAKRAFESKEWRGLDPSRRGRILYKLGALLRERLNDFARLETLNNGKPFGQAKGDIAQSARHFEYFAGLADKIQGSTIPVPGNRFDFTLKEPLGVTGHLVPWNYPLVMAARSIAPALAVGDTVVAKPASYTPLTLLKFGALCKEAGLPDGVLNIVTGGGREVGEALASHPDVKMVALTGSVETGVRVMELASANLTRVALELGGKNPCIVFSDADIDRAVAGVLNGIFTNAGQMCWAGSRLILETSCSKEVLEKIREGARSMKLGEGLDPETKMGPLISSSQRERVDGYVRSGVEDGAELLAGGRAPDAKELSSGYFYEPTVLTGVEQDMKVAQEEIFGPVLSVITFDSPDEAVEKANDTRYGLWAGVWTKNLSRAHSIAQSLDAGIVCVNEEPVTFPQTPFGGFKASGNSSEQGSDAINGYVRVKNVSVNLD
ncbi:MAG TPA: aldehyde dehydrogenase family protein [Nitrososphaerales archaeon]|nr:aldehyde dehydrogenase family protein [Nitrososphaerales archaeon]